MQALRIAYLGWSGFRIDRPDGSMVLIDPPAGPSIPADRPQIVFITHGHPEHLGGVRALLVRDSSAPITVCASADVGRHLARRVRRRRITFVEAHAGMRMQFAENLYAEIFPWRHLPLLPPGGPGPAVAHLLALASRPFLAARIMQAGLLGPRPEPMLGYRIISHDETVLAYGEGLHRLCTTAEVTAQACGGKGETLLAAVEPEDADHLPNLICATKPARVFLYEPHAKWRDAFRLPRADLNTLAAALRRRSIETTVCAPQSEARLEASAQRGRRHRAQ